MTKLGGRYMAIKVIFNKKIKKEVLESFDKKIDDEGFIVENITAESALTNRGEKIKIEEFAGIKKGSEIFIKNDLVSLIDFVKEFYDEYKARRENVQLCE